VQLGAAQVGGPFPLAMCPLKTREPGGCAEAMSLARSTPTIPGSAAELRALATCVTIAKETRLEEGGHGITIFQAQALEDIPPLLSRCFKLKRRLRR
jgi:hypothetical protein